ncbi:TlpA family protein disulfide reductase [Sphingobacterium sp. InxBP1]|uniref:TlpA family protein disulfide reductase n=1 Tax=Sphingobacterium sp. InxBP1 TaxID=2870328 RepID=UPI00224496AA|nr:TlpA disulfide reductase family protein [Sphingobacterium sp. InxBP1]MCW8312058.1 TlpA family protein disulfide reductase [Sphingobacterium sp. InxBP1]
MKLNLIFIILLFANYLFGQHNGKGNEYLNVADRFEVNSSFPVLNYNSTKVNLNVFKDKIIILDFFDTYCVSCIEGMPKLQEMQQQMQDKVQVFMVTWQSKEVIEKFYRNNGFLKEKKVKLPTIVSDVKFKKLFPHQGVPHTVLIYKGKVQAITYPDYIKPKFINELWENGKISLPVKDDYRADHINSTVGVDGVKGSVLLTGYQEGLQEKGGLSITLDTTSGMYTCYFNNVGILRAYIAMYSYMAKPQFLINDQRIQWKVADKSKYEYKENSGGQHIWLNEHGMCYKRTSYRKMELPELAKVVVQDLNSLLGLKVYWGKEAKDCLVIRKLDKIDATLTKPTNGQVMESLSVLTFLMDYSGEYPIVVDESGYTSPIEISTYTGVDELNKQLNAYGLEIVRAKREVDVLVVEETI